MRVRTSLLSVVHRVDRDFRTDVVAILERKSGAWLRRDVGADGEHFLRRRRRQRLGGWNDAGPVRRRRVLAAQKTIDDAIGEADEPRGAVVVLRKHAGDGDERQRSLALACVEMAVVA